MQKNIKQKKAKTVAVINDMSSFGKCSLTAALPVFAACNTVCCPLPTALLSAQTGFSHYFMEDTSYVWDGYIKSWQNMGVKFDGILSGFLTGGLEAKKTYDFIQTFKDQDTLIVVDPVMGDKGKRYAVCDDYLIEEMRRLISCADIITPNLTEFCLISGLDFDKVCKKQNDTDFFEFLHKECQAVFKLGCKRIVVSGIKQNNSILNFIDDKKNYFITKSPYFGVNISGAGDILASIITAKSVKGISLKRAVLLADKFLTKAISNTVKKKFDPNFGIDFEKYLYKLK